MQHPVDIVGLCLGMMTPCIKKRSQQHEQFGTSAQEEAIQKEALEEEKKAKYDKAWLGTMKEQSKL
eukprot:1412405-Ditylum_brightwellii.AAC.1